MPLAKPSRTPFWSIQHAVRCPLLASGTWISHLTSLSTPSSYIYRVCDRVPCVQIIHKSTMAPRPPKPPFSSIWTQMYPPTPWFTEKDLPDLNGKVYIVTGSNTGVGKELAQILYSKNAKVYIVARSEDKASRAIDDIKNAVPQSKGGLVFIHLDLSDLSTIKASVERFTAQESKLHVLFNNAGVQTLGSNGPFKTAQGYEIHLGVNVIGTFLFTKLLTPTLVTTAKSEPPNTVRVVWVSSLGTEFVGEESVGLPLDNLDYHIDRRPLEKYGLSKAGNWLHGVEFAKRYKADGVVSIPLNPGHLHSDLYRDSGLLFRIFLRILITYPSINGAYTELFAGLSPKVTIEETGSWVVPFGRFLPIRRDLLDATKTEAEGGNGHASRFWEWTEDQVRKYV